MAAKDEYLIDMVVRQQDIYFNGIMFLENPETNILVEEVVQRDDHLAIYITEVDNIMIRHLPFSVPPSLIKIYADGEVEIFSMNDMSYNEPLITFNLPFEEYLYIEYIYSERYYNITTEEIPNHLIASKNGHKLLEAFPIIEVDTSVTSGEDNEIYLESSIYAYFNPMDVRRKLVDDITTLNSKACHYAKINQRMLEIDQIDALNLSVGSIYIEKYKSKKNYSIIRIDNMHEAVMGCTVLASTNVNDVGSNFAMGYGDLMPSGNDPDNDNKEIRIYPSYLLVLEMDDDGNSIILNKPEVGPHSDLESIIERFCWSVIEYKIDTMLELFEDLYIETGDDNIILLYQNTCTLYNKSYVLDLIGKEIESGK